MPLVRADELSVHDAVLHSLAVREQRLQLPIETMEFTSTLRVPLMAGRVRLEFAQRWWYRAQLGTRSPIDAQTGHLSNEVKLIRFR